MGIWQDARPNTTGTIGSVLGKIAQYLPGIGSLIGGVSTVIGLFDELKDIDNIKLCANYLNQLDRDMLKYNRELLIAQAEWREGNKCTCTNKRAS